MVHTKYLLFFMVCFLPSMLVHNWGGAAALMHQQQQQSRIWFYCSFEEPIPRSHIMVSLQLYFPSFAALLVLLLPLLMSKSRELNDLFGWEYHNILVGLGPLLYHSRHSIFCYKESRRKEAHWEFVNAVASYCPHPRRAEKKKKKWLSIFLFFVQLMMMAKA